MDLRRVAHAATLEAERQEVDLYALARLLDAYAFVYEHWTWLDLPDHQFTIGHVLQLGAMIEPGRANKLRRTPVVFRNGGTSASHDMVYELLEHRIEEVSTDHEGHLTVEEFIREFLWIHPFEDGNGRVAWILQNWLNRTMDRPEPLKEYDW